MMELATRPLTLSMKTEIEGIRTEAGHKSASHAFASLYSWQREMGLSVFLEDDFFAVKCLLRGANTWFFPCGSEQAVCAFIASQLGKEQFCLCYLREEDRALLNQAFPGRFQIQERPEDAEYLYDRKAQQAMCGKGFVAARKYIHRLEAGHSVEVESLCDENAEEAAALIAGWHSHAVGQGANGLVDTDASATLLRCRKELTVSGVLLRVDHAPAAVMAGFPLSEDTFDIAIGKQCCFLTGTAEYLRRAFCASLPAAYTLVNGEEDLGIEGLRQMKQKMRPIGQIRMYEGRARLGGNS